MNNARTIDGLGRITIPRELMNRLHLRADDQIAVSLQNDSCLCLKTVSLWLARPTACPTTLNRQVLTVRNQEQKTLFLLLITQTNPSEDAARAVLWTAQTALLS